MSAPRIPTASRSATIHGRLPSRSSLPRSPLDVRVADLGSGCLIRKTGFREGGEEKRGQAEEPVDDHDWEREARIGRDGGMGGKCASLPPAREHQGTDRGDHKHRSDGRPRETSVVGDEAPTSETIEPALSTVGDGYTLS